MVNLQLGTVAARGQSSNAVCRGDMRQNLLYRCPLLPEREASLAGLSNKQPLQIARGQARQSPFTCHAEVKIFLLRILHPMAYVVRFCLSFTRRMVEMSSP